MLASELFQETEWFGICSWNCLFSLSCIP